MTNDFYIYGEITQESFFESDISPKSLIDFLQTLRGNEVNIQINSPGGSVFEALAIYNTLKSYTGGVNIIVDGLCASAATLVLCAGSRISAASNALFMIHQPAYMLEGNYNLTDLEKFQNSLDKVKNSILDVYEGKLNKPRAELEKMLDKETWLTAAEALEIGFIDEITDAVESDFDAENKTLCMNYFKFDCTNFDNEKIVAKLGNKQHERSKNGMDEKNFLEKIVNAVTEKLKNNNLKDVTAKAKSEELKRIKNLTDKKGEIAECNAIIDVAIESGKTFEDVKNYFDAVKNAHEKSTEKSLDKTAEYFANVIIDNLKSGAENIGASTPEPTDEDKRMAAVNNIVKYANNNL